MSEDGRNEEIDGPSVGFRSRRDPAYADELVLTGLGTIDVGEPPVSAAIQMSAELVTAPSGINRVRAFAYDAFPVQDLVYLRDRLERLLSGNAEDATVVGQYESISLCLRRHSSENELSVRGILRYPFGDYGTWDESVFSEMRKRSGVSCPVETRFCFRIDAGFGSATLSEMNRFIREFRK